VKSHLTLHFDNSIKDQLGVKHDKIHELNICRPQDIDGCVEHNETASKAPKIPYDYQGVIYVGQDAPW
jgi:hypothetical protein